MASFQKEVKLREEFCIDEICFSATEVRQRRRSEERQSSTAQGMYYIVRVQGRSDAKRATQKFQPGICRGGGSNDRGRRFAFSPQGQKALDQSENSPVLQFRGSERWVLMNPQKGRIVFDLPADSKNPQLEITEGGWPTRLVTAIKNSFFTRRPDYSLSRSLTRYFKCASYQLIIRFSLSIKCSLHGIRGLRAE